MILKAVVVRVQRILFVGFVVLQPLTVWYMNLPPEPRAAIGRLLQRLPTPERTYLEAWGPRIARYGGFVGLDCVWAIYTTLPTYTWWCTFKARYADGMVIVLPLPKQGPRTALQRRFFDVKETKFHFYMLNEPIAQYTYARYLCRTYPSHDAAPIREIIRETHWQDILNPRTPPGPSGHFDPTIHTTTLTYTCPPPPPS